MITALLLQATHYENRFLSENKSQHFLQSVRNRLCPDLVKAKEKINALKQNINISTAQIAGVATLVTAGIGTYYMCNNDSQESPSINSLTPYVDSLVNTGIATIGAALSKNSWPVVLGSLSLLVKPVVAQNCLKEPIPDQIIEAEKPFRWPKQGYLDGYTFNQLTSIIKIKEKNMNRLPIWLEFTDNVFYKDSEGQRTNDLEVSNSIVYLANVDKLTLLNATDINNLKPLSNFVSSGKLYKNFCQYIDLINTTAFCYYQINYFQFRLTIINVSNPSYPTELSTNDIYYSKSQIESVHWGFKVSKTTAYIASNGGGLQIINVSDPKNPSINYQFNNIIPGSIKIVDSKAYISNPFAGVLSILDIQNPYTPVLLAKHNIAHKDLDVLNTTLYLAVKEGLMLYDISNPTNLNRLAKYISNTYSSNIVGVYAVTISQNIAYILANQKILDLINVTNPRVPTLINSRAPNLINSYDVKPAQNTVVIGTKIYIAAGPQGLQIIDLARGYLEGTPSKNISGKNFEIQIRGNNCAQSLNLLVDQFPKRTTMSLLDKSMFPGNYFEQSLKNIFFDNDKNDFLQLSYKLKNGNNLPLWINKTANMNVIDSVIIPNIGYNTLDLVGSKTVLCLLGILGIAILEVNNSIPKLLTIYDKEINVQIGGKIDIRDSKIYALINKKFLVFNLSNNNLKLLRNFDINSYFDSFTFIKSGILFNNDREISIFNINSLNNLMLLGKYKFDHLFSKRVEILDTTAYALNWLENVEKDINGKYKLNYENQLLFLNISNPYNITKLGMHILDDIDLGSSRTDLVDLIVQKDTAYIFDKKKLQIINIKDIFQPKKSGELNIKANSLKIVGLTAFFLNAKSFHIVDLTEPTNPLLIGTYLPTFQLFETFYKLTVLGNYIYIATPSTIYTFDINYQLSGMPNITNVGNYPIVVTATDIIDTSTIGSNISDSFTLRVEGPPRVNNSVQKQYAKIGQTYNYFLQGVFSDPNFDPLSFSVKLNSNEAFPDWLSFNLISATFSGIPPEMPNKTLSINVRATDNIPYLDGQPGSANTNFELYVDHAPQVNNPISDQNARYNKKFEYLIKDNTFKDLDNDPLSYSLDSKLPKWLNYSIKDNIIKLFGNPNKTDIGNYIIKVKASDPYKGEAATDFIIRVQNNIKPEVIGSVIGVPIAKVLENYLFVLNMKDIFNDRNNDNLTYSVQAKPDWITFQATSDPSKYQFSGRPKRGDHNFFGNLFAEKIDPIVLLVQDDLGAQAKTTFDIKMTGDYYALLALKVLGPVGTAYTAYKKRALFINEWNKRRENYQKAPVSVGVEDKAFEHKLQTNRQDVNIVQVYTPSSPAPKWYEIWKSSKLALPGGNLLPHWLSYHEKENLLYSNKNLTNSDVGNLILQVRDKDGIIKEEFSMFVNSDKVPTQSQNVFEDIEMMHAEPLLSNTEKL